MKVQVIDCKKSFKFVNMWVVTYEVSKLDFLTGKEVKETHNIFSEVPVEKGERTLVKAYNEDKSKFWVKEVK